MGIKGLCSFFLRTSVWGLRDLVHFFLSTGLLSKLNQNKRTKNPVEQFKKSGMYGNFPGFLKNTVVNYDRPKKFEIYPVVKTYDF